VSLYQKCKTNLDFTEARDSEWQWHQLGHMQVCTALQTDSHASTRPITSHQTYTVTNKPIQLAAIIAAGIDRMLMTTPSHAPCISYTGTALTAAICAEMDTVPPTLE